MEATLLFLQKDRKQEKITYKICTFCKLSQNSNLFYIRRKKIVNNNLCIISSSYCIPCAIQKQKEWKYKKREKQMTKLGFKLCKSCNKFKHKSSFKNDQDCETCKIKHQNIIDISTNNKNKRIYHLMSQQYKNITDILDASIKEIVNARLLLSNIKSQKVNVNNYKTLWQNLLIEHELLSDFIDKLKR